MNPLKKLASMLPSSMQDALRQMHYTHEIRKGGFDGGEPEFDRLATMLSAGDWAIDVGANIGHYTNRMSEIVGREGRVIAFEPVPATFRYLVNNMSHSRFQNMSLINAAASSETMLTGMTVPACDTGLDNLYRANITTQSFDADYQILCLSIDSLALDQRVALMKIDAEGHEPDVVLGALKTIERDKPVIIIETVTDEIRTRLESMGYAETKLAGSPNCLFMQ